MKILGIETSCDETAAAVISKEKNNIKILSSVISSQINIHKKYGGVVPEIAAREHVLHILPIIDKTLKKAKIKKDKLSAIAIANGPGLITSLQTGVETAKALSFAWDIPIIPINHIEAHIYSGFIDHYRKIKFPALILTVSGGHTNLVLMQGHGKYKKIGETRDDAAGEAFDKAAKLMDIGYPGGPIVSAKAEEFRIKPARHPGGNLELRNINLPRPMIHTKDFDFSFSGLKTALLYELQNDKQWKKKIPEYCYEFQQAVVDVLIHKTIKAAKKFKTNSVILTGGVSANKELRKQLEEAVNKKLDNVNFFTPKLSHTTDNAAMVAMAGLFKKPKSWKKISADCNFEL